MTRSRPNRILAIDWSGAVSGAQRRIWLCEVARGEVRRLECGRDRDEIASHLLDEAERDPRFVVGIDFAFSFPHGFLRKRAHRAVGSVWEEARRLGEKWLSHCPFPFWGKPGKKKPGLGDPLFRRTDLEVADQAGRRPMSVFQIGGAGAVGVGSIRGMPILGRLRAGGISIWPFDEPRLPVAVEIWPRLFTGPVNKSSPEARSGLLRERYPELDRELVRSARDSDDAFDALVSGLEMDRCRRRLARLERSTDQTTRLEGRIWSPESG